MLNAAALHVSIAEELRRAFDDVLASGRFIGGEAVEKFESDLAEMLGVCFAVGTSSGTDALLAALSALGVRPGDEIITTPYTFFATAGSIARLGAKPVFADIEPLTFNIDPRAVEAAVTDRTVGIVPVHLFGQCADMTSILEIASAHGLWVLEDAAQSLGATLNGRLAGTMGIAGALSFFPAKNLGALGDAGAVVTCDEALSDKMRSLGNHGAREKYRHELVGGNFRLDALQAAFLSVKLPHLNKLQKARQKIAARYREGLRDLNELSLPVEVNGAHHVYNQFVIRTSARDSLCDFLAERGIETALYYPAPLHMQPCFAELGYKQGAFPAAEQASCESLALPMDPLLDEEAQQWILDAIHIFFKDRR